MTTSLRGCGWLLLAGAIGVATPRAQPSSLPNIVIVLADEDNELRAVRKGPYKAHFITSGAYGEGEPRREHNPPLLFNLTDDPGERRNIAGARKQWFEPSEDPILVLWWIPAGQIPTVADAQERLQHLKAHGPSAHAFTFRAPFSSPEGQPGDVAGLDAAFCEWTT